MNPKQLENPIPKIINAKIFMGFKLATTLE